MSTINIKKLSGVGAEVTGVDIAAGISDTEFSEIKRAFSDEGLIFFRGSAERCTESPLKDVHSASSLK